MKAVIFFLAGIYMLMLPGCERDITLELPLAGEQLVVEGYVFADTLPPYVFVTTNIPFFSQMDSSTIQQNIVRGAKVILSDGIQTDTMLEFEYQYLHVYYAPNIRGQAGRTYSLRVEAEGKVVTSVTYLPPPVHLDSVWWIPDGTKDSLGFAWAHLSDPDTLGNYYRWFAKRINSYTYGENEGEQKDIDFIAPIGSTFEDRFINGKSFDFGYNRGTVGNSTKEDDEGEERGYFKRGDTIVVKFCTYDRANYNFWRDAESQISSNGNPFGNPTPIYGNIEGGLGVFGGYGVSYDTIIAR